MYNVSGAYLTEEQKAELIEQFALPGQDIQQVVVMDNLDLALKLKPYAKEVIVRRYPFSADNAYQRGITVDQAIATCAPECTSGMTAYYDNEPGPNGSSWADCFRHYTAIAEAFGKRGWKIVIGNWSVGRPDKNDWLTEEGKAFLRMCAKYHKFVRIGLHEYFPSFWAYELTNDETRNNYLPQHRWNQVNRWTYQTHYVGRYVTLFAVFDIMGLPSSSWPKLSFTEVGVDRVDDAKKWQQHVPGYGNRMGIRDHIQAFTNWCTPGTNWVDYAYGSYKKMYEVFFAPYAHLHTGVSAFCYGSEGDWYRYDIAQTTFRFAFDVNPFKGASPVATIKTGYYLIPPGVNSQLRSTPGGTSRAVLSGGTVVQVDRAETASAEGWDWAHVIAPPFEPGWVALLKGAERMIYLGPTPPKYGEPQVPSGGLTDAQKLRLSALLEKQAVVERELGAFFREILT